MKQMRARRPAITQERILEINKLIETNPGWNQSKLSQELCKMWDWRGENGLIKDISCRDVLRALDAAGEIKLPKPQRHGRSKGGADIVPFMLHDSRPIEESLSELKPLSVEVVAGKSNLMEFKSYVVQYHYLGYDRNIGENINAMSETGTDEHKHT